jgi:hypothetical protein
MQSAQVSSGEEMRFDSRPHRKQRLTRSSSFPDHLGALFLLLLYNEDSRIPNKVSEKHLQNRDDFKSGRESEEEAIRRRAGMESKLYWQVGERAEE